MNCEILPRLQLLEVETVESAWQVEPDFCHFAETEQNFLKALGQSKQNIKTEDQENLEFFNTTQTSCFGMRPSPICPTDSVSFNDDVSCSLRIEWQFIILLQPFSVDSEPLSSGYTNVGKSSAVSGFSAVKCDMYSINLILCPMLNPNSAKWRSWSFRRLQPSISFSIEGKSC